MLLKLLSDILSMKSFTVLILKFETNSQFLVFKSFGFIWEENVWVKYPISISKCATSRNGGGGIGEIFFHINTEFLVYVLNFFQQNFFLTL